MNESISISSISERANLTSPSHLTGCNSHEGLRCQAAEQAILPLNPERQAASNQSLLMHP